MMYENEVNNNQNEHARNMMNCLQETNNIFVWGCIQGNKFNYIAVEPSIEILDDWLSALEKKHDKFRVSTNFAALYLAVDQINAHENRILRAMRIEETLSKSSRKFHNVVVKPGIHYVKKTGDLTMQWIIMPFANVSMEKIIKPTRNIFTRKNGE